MADKTRDPSELLVETLLRLNEISQEPTRSIADFALHKAIEMTRSEIGYFALLDQDQTFATIYCCANSEMGREVASRTESVSGGGRWAEVVRRRSAVVINEVVSSASPENESASGAKLLRYMDVPVFDGERITAIAGVSNKPAPYDEGETRQLKLLTTGVWRLLQRKREDDRLRATAEALRRSEAYLAQAQRLSHIGSWVDDGAMRPVYWSEEHHRIFGFDSGLGLPTRQEALNRIHPDDREGVKQAFQMAVREKVDAEVEYRIVLPDGTVKYAHSIGRPILDPHGQLVEIVGTTSDITEGKRTEEALALRSFALNHANDAVALLEENGRIVFVNDQACRQSGYSRDELLSMSAWDVNSDFTEESWSLHWETLKAQQSLRFESCHRRRNGDIYPVEISAKYLEYKGRAFNVAVIRDIAEHKKAEGALRRSESYLAEAQRLTHTGSFASDTTTKPLYWSEELFRIFGFDPALGLPSREQPLERVHPDDRQKFLQAFDRAIREKLDGEVEFRIVLPDGTTKYAHGIGHPILNADGDLVEFVGTTVDITERKRAEEARAKLQKLEADLAHINRVSMMGELTASIAHEVNQPLSGVVSNASACLRWLAAETPNVDEAREAARRIVRDGKRAAEIIARTRAMTKRALQSREKLDLSATIREILPLVGDESKKRSVTIRTSFTEEVIPVLGDRVQLQQVVLNLVMNGLEAMSTVTDRPLELEIASRNTGEAEVEVTIRDSGIGFEPEQCAHLFDAFYTTKSTGMGMGLSICRSILEAHGGRLWATPNQGPGATFHFTLPRETENADAERV